MILDKDGSLLEDFSTLTTGAEKTLNNMFHVEEDVSDLTQGLIPGTIASDLLNEMISHVLGGDDTETENDNTMKSFHQAEEQAEAHEPHADIAGTIQG